MFDIDQVTKLIRTALVNIGNPSTENEGINSLRGALRRMSATGFDPHNLVCVDFTKETLTARLYEIIKKKDTLIAERDAEIRRLASRVEALRRGRQEPRAIIDPIKFQTPIPDTDLGNEADFGARLRAAMDAAVEPPVEPVPAVEPIAQSAQSAPESSRRDRGDRRNPDRFAWNKEVYLHALNMYRNGTSTKKIAAEFGIPDNPGTIDGKFLNTGPFEKYLGHIEVHRDNSPMSYLELWKILHFLNPDVGTTWVSYLKKKFKLDPKRGFGGKEPTYLSVEQIAQLRREYHRKAK